MTSLAFLDALYAAFPTPQGPPAAPTTAAIDAEASAIPGKAKKRPAPAASRGKTTPPPPPARSKWMEQANDAFIDPFAAPQYSAIDTQLLRILCVDHVDLLEASEREKTRSAVGAVVTTKRHTPEPKKKAAAIPPAQQLLQHCAQYVSSAEFAVFSDTELAETIVQTVEDARGQEDLIQSHLFGLVGVDGMELIAFVMQHAAQMGKGGSITRQTIQDAAKQQQLLSSSTTGGARPAVASSFSIQTATEQLQQKQQRKAQRKARAQAGGGNTNVDDDEDNLQWLEAAGYDLEVLRLQRQFEDEEKRNDPTSLLLREFGELRGGYDTSGAAGQLTSAGALSLPASTKRTYYKGYEHVHIPAHAKKALAKGETLVPISQLEPFAQSAFKGMKSLNRLQSKLFNAAYSTNQNLLVCAPTGAGKTNVAMLTILQQIRSHLQRSERNPLAHMKIIYVAPMKALAQEVVTKFGERLRELKLRVAELTGDMQMTKKEIEETHLIVTTPEKWDVITRKSSAQQALLSQVKLLIIDEVHLLADQRGPVIETIVARTLRRVESTQSMIRIVGLSATLPNYADVATFLRVYVPPGDANAQNAAVNGGKGGLFFFDSTYRPVPLDQTFIGVSTTGNGLKDALNMSASQLTKTLETEEDRAKNSNRNNTAPSNMSKLRQVQMLMNKLALVHCLAQVRRQEQVMVFVHSRKDTAATMRAIIELATNDEEEPDLLEAFLPPQDLPKLPSGMMDRLAKSRNKELKDLYSYGLGIHHAGMLRSDRNLTEELFEKGYIRVLCCTATLAWGVNLPAHSVLIKGTQVYNSDKGGMTQLSMLDVMQIFGRAGRPQYDTSGDAVLMTTQDQLPHYLRLLTTGIPMESALIKALPDHLNAEIVSGTVTNLDEACEWLSYTYLYVRMKKNPLSYGLKYDDVQGDPQLIERRKQLLMDAAEKLQACRMVKILKEKTRLDQPENTGKIVFAVTSIGRVASHFYIQHTSIQTFNDLLDAKTGGGGDDNEDNDLDWEKALLVLCSSNEFEQLKAREEEMNELEKLQRNFCRFDVRGGGMETYMGKTNVVLQALIGRARITSFTLISDTNYVAQNASRVCRALFEISLKKHNARHAEMFLQLANSIDQKMWWDQNLLLQLPNVPMDVVAMVDQQRRFSLYDTLADESGEILDKLPAKARKWVTVLPFMDVENVLVQPFGGNMLRIAYALRPLFHEWREHIVGGRTLTYWLWVEDAVTGFIYHSEYVALHQSRFLGWKEGTQRLDMECFVPVFVSSESNEANYVIRLLSDRLVGIETYYEVAYTPAEPESKKTDKEKENDMYTKLLTLHPQPLQSLQNPVFQSLYVSKFQSFNPIQTQAFHQLYHQDGNVLLCAPTGSGKTLCAELAMLRVWNKVAKAQAETSSSEPSLIVYIAPLKALAREKVADWKALFERNRELRKKVVEVTGDTLVHVEFILNKADIVVTTPEKWDLLTRHVIIGRQLMRRTALVIVDEVHLVGEAPRGAVLEVLVSRLRRFSRDGGNAIRLVGLSTALANAHDVGQWLGITKDNGGEVYNFRASVRPVPMEVHIQGFPERHFVSRMAAMNKPTFMAIRTHSPEKPALVFVSSKAQTKLTALDLISFCVAQADSGVGGSTGGAKPFLKVDDSVMDAICNSRGSRVVDETLRHTLSFGIGLHHAGLARSDRELVEKLFRDKMIQVVISTSTLAWGVNLPAHLVVIKGTEYFQNGRYRSYPLSDLLQMIGRAGRPLLDIKGVACVLVEDAKKNMIQRLLYEPLAIESTLGDHLVNHLNAEIAGGLITHTKDVVQYLSWSLLFQRVVKNPSFYGYGQQVEGGVEAFFKALVDTTVQSLVDTTCVTLDKKSGDLRSTPLGKIASALYVDVRSVAAMQTLLSAAITQKRKADEEALSDAAYWQLCVLRSICASCVELRETTPLRHHEVQSGLAAELCAQVAFSPMTKLFPQPKKMLLETHGSELKAFLLVQMHLQKKRMPSSDFTNDLRALLDQLPRLLSAAIDIGALLHHKELVVAGIQLSQGIVQGTWLSVADKPTILTQLPLITDRVAKELQTSSKITSFEDLRVSLSENIKRTQMLAAVKNAGGSWNDAQLQDLRRAIDGIPRFHAVASTKPANADGTVIVQIELKAVDSSARSEATALANAHAKNRLQKPKPYGFYLLLTSTSSGETLQVKHVTWKIPRVNTQFAPVAVGGGAYSVHIYSDAIAGIDQVVEIP